MAENQDGERATKLAVLGKGGSGKTVLASLLVRAISERGFMVLAVDLDANPGLSVSLGLDSNDTPLPDAAVEERPDTPFGWGLARHLTPAEAVRRYGTPAGPNVVFVGFGNNAAVDTPLLKYLTAVREVSEGFDEPGWAMVADLAAGPTTPFEGYARFASLALIAVEATPASILTAQGLLDILADDGTPAAIVVTKAQAGDAAHIAKEVGEPFACIPFDADIRQLERRQGPLLDLPTDNPALAAVREMVGCLGL